MSAVNKIVGIQKGDRVILRPDKRDLWAKTGLAKPGILFTIREITAHAFTVTWRVSHKRGLYNYTAVIAVLNHFCKADDLNK